MFVRRDLRDTPYARACTKSFSLQYLRVISGAAKPFGNGRTGLNFRARFPARTCVCVCVWCIHTFVYSSKTRRNRAKRIFALFLRYCVLYCTRVSYLYIYIYIVVCIYINVFSSSSPTFPFDVHPSFST